MSSTIFQEQNMVSENDLEKIFKEHTGNIIHKWQHYFEIYDRHFQRFRNRKVVILEIGVFKGGSLEMWRKYFGSQCEIIGIDINPLCKRFENANTKIYIGSQEDRDFLRRIKQEISGVDILIDDGGHMMNQLRISFEELYDWVAKDGIYVAEDLHTCYWTEYEGGFKRKTSFVEYSKDLIDHLNAWHSRNKELSVSRFTRNTHSIHFYDSVVVFEKRRINKPFHLYSGKVDDNEIDYLPLKMKNLWSRVKNKVYSVTGIEI